MVGGGEDRAERLPEDGGSDAGTLDVVENLVQ